MDGALIDKGCFEKPFGCSSEFDPYRSKVAEEMLLCEVMVQFSICRKQSRSEICL
jgi:hypothetical protein